MFKSTKLIFICFIGLSFFLAAFPFFDVLFSNLFYSGNNQFVVQHYPVHSIYFYEFIIREMMLPIIIIFLLFFPIIIKISEKTKNKFIEFNFKTKDILYIWTSAIFVTIVVESVFKGFWGRARPVDTTLFGGEKDFSAWINYSAECATNCSFVSGDASVGFFISCLYYITKKNTYLYLSIVFGLIIGLTRIGAGAHFLSDISMSFVLVNLILFINYYCFTQWSKTKT